MILNYSFISQQQSELGLMKKFHNFIPSALSDNCPHPPPPY
ncbi:2951_t:CDS:2 [Entrophospora sp. SA101]|nr:2951_t:CDS:2 [Entrophospora sp. SA101]